jgi:hypothetical protein
MYIWVIKGTCNLVRKHLPTQIIVLVITRRRTWRYGVVIISLTCEIHMQSYCNHIGYAHIIDWGFTPDKDACLDESKPCNHMWTKLHILGITRPPPATCTQP